MPCICYMFNPSKTCLPSSALPIVALWPKHHWIAGPTTKASGPKVSDITEPALSPLFLTTVGKAPIQSLFLLMSSFYRTYFLLPSHFFIKALWFTKAFQLSFRCIILQHQFHHQGLLPSTNVPRFPSLYPHPPLLSSLLTGTFPMFTVSH